MILLLGPQNMSNLASNVIFTPSGNITATNVQDALEYAATATGTAVSSSTNLTETNVQAAISRLALHSRYDPGSEPTSDQGDIWINGIGLCSFDTTLNKYMRSPGIYLYKKVFTANSSITFDAYTKIVRYSGCGAGGGGGAGAGNTGPNNTGSGGGGGGSGQFQFGVELNVSPGSTETITIGAPGTGGQAGGSAGGNGGNTQLGTLVTLLGGGGGYPGLYSGTSNNSRGAESSDPSGGQPGGGGQDSGSSIYGSGCGGMGGGCPFGMGGVPGMGRYQGAQDGNRAVNGKGGYGYGAGGGGGGGAYNSTTNVTGGIGGNGVGGLLIIEY